tara:strand:- start:515 stop:1540 length:1026 start_codon:yes stop_codon:yes gene_type:complete
MIKANAYGFGDILIAKKLEEFGINYFGVADFEEGVRLRDNGINSKIMVMNTSKSSIPMLIKHKLEPVIYSMELLNEMMTKAGTLLTNQKPYPIHIKVNTGMNRWGFDNYEIPGLIKRLKRYSKDIIIESLYSHFASAEDHENLFTIKQINNFRKIKNQFEEAFSYNIATHIHNSRGLINFSHTISEFNFSRIGIALYGLSEHPNFKPIGELRCRILQVRSLQPNERVGYNGGFVANKPMKIATIPFGYADGLQRGWGNGSLKFYYKGHFLPTIGHISMDSCSVDVTDVFSSSAVSDNSSLVNEEIIYFGKDRPIWDLSKELNTIPYEIVSTLSRRIKRVYN